MAASTFLEDDNLSDLLERNVSPAQYENIFDGYNDIQITNFEDDYSMFLSVASRILPGTLFLADSLIAMT